MGVSLGALTSATVPFESMTGSQSWGDCGSAPPQRAQVQLEGEAALLRSGKVEAVLSLSDSAAVMPRISSVCPIAVLAGDAATEVTISGSCLACNDVTLSSRMHGVP